MKETNSNISPRFTNHLTVGRFFNMSCLKRGRLNNYLFSKPEEIFLVNRDLIKTSSKEWIKSANFSRTIAKGPKTITWIWNLHANAHDFNILAIWRRFLEKILLPIWPISIIFLWLSGLYFHSVCFSNYEAWLSNAAHIGSSAQVIWPIVGKEILNGDVGGGFQGIQITL